jgi:hypothetical protein
MDNAKSYFLIGPFTNKTIHNEFKKIYNNIDKSASKVDIIKLELDKICKEIN